MSKKKWTVEYVLDVSAQLPFSPGTPQLNIVSFDILKGYAMAILNTDALEKAYDQSLRLFQRQYESGLIQSTDDYPKITSEGASWRFRWKNELHPIEFYSQGASLIKLPLKLLQGITEFQEIELHQQLRITEKVANLDVLLGYAGSEGIHTFTNFSQLNNGSWLVGVTESRTQKLPLAPGIQNLAYDPLYSIRTVSPKLELLASQDCPVIFYSPEKYCVKYKK